MHNQESGFDSVVNEFGDQRWYKNGKLHRDDGPAVIYADGATVWLLDGKACVTLREFQQLTNKSEEELSYLVLKYGEIK